MLIKLKGVKLNFWAGQMAKVWLNIILRHKLFIKVDLPPAFGPVRTTFLGLINPICISFFTIWFLKQDKIILPH